MDQLTSHRALNSVYPTYKQLVPGSRLLSFVKKHSSPASSCQLLSFHTDFGVSLRRSIIQRRHQQRSHKDYYVYWLQQRLRVIRSQSLCDYQERFKFAIQLTLSHLSPHPIILYSTSGSLLHHNLEQPPLPDCGADWAKTSSPLKSLAAYSILIALQVHHAALPRHALALKWKASKIAACVSWRPVHCSLDLC